MFRQQNRTDRHNRLLAGYLAFVGGFVNAAGLVLVGNVTSHVTGNVTHFANDLAAGEVVRSLLSLAMVGAFFGGAFVASMMVESDLFGGTPNAYGAALSVESIILVAFIALAAPPRPAEASLLCAAMGMQNSLVTRLSGAVVRTTHLTGVVTDLGIEAARWFRWWRAVLSRTTGSNVALGRSPTERPAVAKVALLATIASAFVTGAILGAVSARHLDRWALGLPSTALAVGAAYAFRSTRAGLDSIPPPGPESRA
jgi:uncharacterized membrane protein YoaK (UPF0700 family)